MRVKRTNTKYAPKLSNHEDNNNKAIRITRVKTQPVKIVYKDRWLQFLNERISWN